jgi:MYXO-CTERM domain-containing protein
MRDGNGLQTIADDLPAVAAGTFVWNVADLSEGDWTLRATITDARGKSFSAYSRYFLLVTHLQRPVDGGVADSGTSHDAGEAHDAGVTPPPLEGGGDDGCRCVAGRSGDQWIAALALLVLFPLHRRRSGR